MYIHIRKHVYIHTCMSRVASVHMNKHGKYEGMYQNLGEVYMGILKSVIIISNKVKKATQIKDQENI